MVSEFVVCVWDGLDQCEISWPEILSQSGSAYHQFILSIFHFLNYFDCPTTHLPATLTNTPHETFFRSFSLSLAASLLVS